MRIGIIIPDRGDRPKFMDNCLRMIDAQTLKAERIVVKGYENVNGMVDITERYRTGYMHLCGKDLDVIAFIENDDWYDPHYLEYMTTKWIEYGKPEIFGTNYTIYYHLKLRKYFTMEHYDRASAMNTFIKPDLDLKWPADNDPYTDIHLWQKNRLNGIVINPERVISIGMKHGEGLCGGRFHTDKLATYTNEDNGFLKATLDAESYEFYNNYQ